MSVNNYDIGKEKKLLTSKTFWSSILTLAIAIADSFGLNVPKEIYVGLGSLIAIFMRQGIINK